MPKLEYTHTDGEVWTVQRIIDYGNRKYKWARKRLKLVLAGELDLDTVLKESQKKFYRDSSKDIFIGKPTEEYPEGRKYTPELVKSELRKQGVVIDIQSAVQRVRRAMRNPKLEETILKPSRFHKNMVPQENLSEDQKEILQSFNDFYLGKLSINQLLKK